MKTKSSNQTTQTTTGKPLLLAYHSDPSIKHRYVRRVQAHRRLDQIVKGQYWEHGRGCAVGCTIHGSDHSKYETELGIPLELAYLQDEIFENLQLDQAVIFPERFLKAIKPGADLSKVIARFVVWQGTDPEHGLLKIIEDPEEREIVQLVSGLYQREADGGVVLLKEWEDTYDRAWAGAWSRAWAWAWAGARARAGAWAWAGARARAGAWAGAGSSSHSLMADKLIGLLTECTPERTKCQ